MRLHTRMACSCEVESVGPDNWIALRRLCVNNTVNMCIGTNKRSDTFLCERQWQKLLCANRNLSRTHNRAEALPYLTPGRMSSHTCFVGGCVLHGWLELHTQTICPQIHRSLYLLLTQGRMGFNFSLVPSLHVFLYSTQPRPSSDTRSNGPWTSRWYYHFMFAREEKA